MTRQKIVAIITGAISIILAIAYLVIVQILDYRDMQPAPIGQIPLENIVGKITVSVVPNPTLLLTIISPQ